jgi:hypothetical protein
MYQHGPRCIRRLVGNAFPHDQVNDGTFANSGLPENEHIQKRLVGDEQT